MKHLLMILALVALPAPLVAGVNGFQLVNGTDLPLADVAIRRAGSDSWKPLGASPTPGASQAVKFSDRDCAFDIRADAGGKLVSWTGINLCDVNSVILKSDPTIGPWVDYDAP